MNIRQNVQLPCFLRQNDELALLQYHGRPHRRQVAPSEVKMKPEMKILQLTERLTTGDRVRKHSSKSPITIFELFFGHFQNQSTQPLKIFAEPVLGD